MNLEANEIDFNDEVGSVDVDGAITFKTTDAQRAVLVEQDTIKTNALNIDSDDMAALQSGFTAITFGKVTGGDVKLSTNIDFDSDLGLYGKNIQIQDSSDDFVIGGKLTIGATKNITLSNTVLASGSVEMKTTEGKIKVDST